MVQLVDIRRAPWALVIAAVAVCVPGLDGVTAAQRLNLGQADIVADGVEHFHLDDPALVDPKGPISVHVLRIDPTRVRLESALAQSEVMGRETVLETARRHEAIAAVNAGFFEPSGDPTGVLKVAGELVSDASRPRGVVAILDSESDGPQRLVFDRLTVSATATFAIDGVRHTHPIAGVDTTRLRGHLMLFTPRYHEHTDTAPAGTEWSISGSPATVQTRRSGVGKTPIPEDGFVLSFGGVDPPAPLDRLGEGVAVEIDYEFRSALGTPADVWREANHIVGGAGLLLHDGTPVDDWTPERFRDGFTTERHPRTLVGRDAHGAIWLIAVDGREPDRSVGMTFAELQRLAVRVGLRDALNLDGGGSTTFVIGDRVVNDPSDATGPRPVSDSLLVVARAGR